MGMDLGCVFWELEIYREGGGGLGVRELIGFGVDMLVSMGVWDF